MLDVGHDIWYGLNEYYVILETVVVRVTRD